MNKVKPINTSCKPLLNHTLKALLRVCSSKRERHILKLLWRFQGVLTHELSEKFGCKSNNHHNVSQDLNPRLIRLGWVISKYPASQPSESWRWYLEPVYVALQKPIRRDLRRTIHKHMEAANDE